ncbi:glyoxalase family protein [Metarhizium robertsii ARSEF 23]|uniref:Glyoxalase family protein n=1 Tax=Metarhizium robertsii (strain ARSEF 23 / ATCC MYA-3075) TaxID=655844 RepID=E9F8H1_METRA|nr:glyoxalase family protein [Metarhizium robertsii ARSEF 23]EFY95917.2 glyoxalase family protein [Metarhizium robertsii ARSEF 23]
MESVGAVEATLSSAATTIALVHQGMAAHKLGRAGTKNLLGQVADRGPVDGRLIDQARKDRRTEQYAYYLLSEYARLLEWLADQHFSVPAAAVSWYDPRRVVVGAYRVPLVFANRRCRELKELVDSIKELAGQLVAENIQAAVNALPTTLSGGPLLKEDFTALERRTEAARVRVKNGT